MYTVYIVDDEPPARNGLRDCVDWDRFGIQVIGEADDGETALLDICKHSPDIVISDVKMPNMDGIELCLRLRSMGRNIKIILMSAYSDVSYLKSALEVDAIDYVLKPINLKEMEGIIHKAVKELDDEKNRKELMHQMNEKLEKSMPLLREKFFLTLIHDEIEDITSLNDMILFLDISLQPDGLFCVFVISIDDQATVFRDMTQMEKQMMSYLVISICEQILASQTLSYVFEDKQQGEYVCIININNNVNQDDLYKIALDMKQELTNFCDFSVTLGIGSIIESINQIHTSYKAANNAVEQKLFIGKNQIILADNTDIEVSTVYSLDHKLLEKISMYLKIVDTEHLQNTLDEAFKEIRISNITIMNCRSFCLQVYLTSLSILPEIDPKLYKQMNHSERAFWEQLFALETIHDIQGLLTNYLMNLCNLVHEKNSKKSKVIIEKIKEIIQNRYMENLTIQTISEEVFLTHTYICLIFKQETGETINDYLTKVRIEKAKEMLMNPHNKMYDICHAIGYTDPSYFSKIFKRYSGLSPAKYREDIMYEHQ